MVDWFNEFVCTQCSVRALNEVCVTEAVVRSIRAASALPPHSEGRSLLLRDLEQLLCDLALKALALHHGMQVNTHTSPHPTHTHHSWLQLKPAKSDLAAVSVATIARASDSMVFVWQTICDMHHQLTFVELTSSSEAERLGARDAQAALFAAQLQRLEERLGDSYAPHNKYANYFTTGTPRCTRAHTHLLHITMISSNELPMLHLRFIKTISMTIRYT